MNVFLFFTGATVPSTSWPSSLSSWLKWASASSKVSASLVGEFGKLLPSYEITQYVVIICRQAKGND